MNTPPKTLIRTSTQPDGIFNQPALDLGMQRRHTLVIKRNLSTDKNIEDDTETPYIDLWSGVHLRIEKFGCSKVERSTESGEVGGGVVEIR